MGDEKLNDFEGEQKEGIFRTVLLKLSGTVFRDSFDELVPKIREEVQEGVRFILIFGGGFLINKLWNDGGNSKRTMLDGFGVTDEGLLDEAVVPAYLDIRSRIESAFGDDVVVVDPESVECDYMGEEYGLVGGVRRADGVRLDSSITGFGFLGDVEGQKVNVNGDNLALGLMVQFLCEIDEVVFLTRTKGINTRPGGNVTHPKIELKEGDIWYPTLNVAQGMRLKLEVVQSMLGHVDRVLITNTDGFCSPDRGYGVGEGTLCFKG